MGASLLENGMGRWLLKHRRRIARRVSYQGSSIGAVEAVDSHGGLDLVAGGCGRGEGPGLREDSALPGSGGPRGTEEGLSGQHCECVGGEGRNSIDAGTAAQSQLLFETFKLGDDAALEVSAILGLMPEAQSLQASRWLAALPGNPSGPKCGVVMQQYAQACINRRLAFYFCIGRLLNTVA